MRTNDEIIDSETHKEEALKNIGKSYSWSYLTAFYYTFITVTSIGFGDVYKYSTSKEKAMTPFLSFIMTTLLIALFTRVFGKMQAAIEDRSRVMEQRARDKEVFGMLPDSTEPLKAGSGVAGLIIETDVNQLNLAEDFN